MKTIPTVVIFELAALAEKGAKEQFKRCFEKYENAMKLAYGKSFDELELPDDFLTCHVLLSDYYKSGDIGQLDIEALRQAVANLRHCV